ncbi:hypothetical protein L208DRAFT_1381702 [Tricholoma matsutake]|nr:hypothetical protein L208DRAFT_1381702 [Tricholoma matsutake 945]
MGKRKLEVIQDSDSDDSMESLISEPPKSWTKKKTKLAPALSAVKKKSVKTKSVMTVADIQEDNKEVVGIAQATKLTNDSDEDNTPEQTLVSHAKPSQAHIGAVASTLASSGLFDKEAAGVLEALMDDLYEGKVHMKLRRGMRLSRTTKQRPGMWAADFDDVLDIPQSRSTSCTSIASESSGVIFDNEDDNNPNEKMKHRTLQNCKKHTIIIGIQSINLIMIPAIQNVKAAIDLKAISNVVTTATKPVSAAKMTQSVKIVDISKHLEWAIDTSHTSKVCPTIGKPNALGSKIKPEVKSEANIHGQAVDWMNLVYKPMILRHSL